MNKITYGTILKSKINGHDEIITLVNNITNGDGYNCKVLDLSTMELIDDYLDINDFTNNNKYEIIGKIDFENILRGELNGNK